MKREKYTMTPEQYDRIIEACRPVPMIMLQCGEPLSQQESANRAWQSLGQELGFDGMTVEPINGGSKFEFTAIPLEQTNDR